MSLFLKYHGWILNEDIAIIDTDEESYETNKTINTYVNVLLQKKGVAKKKLIKQ